MKRALSLILLLCCTTTVFSQFNYRWIDIPVNDKSNWTFFEHLDNVSKDPNFSKYTWDIQRRLTQTEIEQIDCALTDALSPHSIRLSFAISTDYKTIVPIALSINRGFIKYSSWNHVQLPSDSIAIEPLYVVPFSEYWHLLSIEEQTRIASVYKDLLDRTLFGQAQLNGDTTFFLRLDELVNSEILDKRDLQQHVQEIPCMLHPDKDILSFNEIKNLVSPADTLYTESGPIITHPYAEIHSICVLARSVIELNDSNLYPDKGQILYSINTEYVGIEIESQTPANTKTIIWTKKTVLVNILENPPLLNGIEYLWAEKLERKMKK